ncbi:alpha/beta fold hydrolase [Granulicoccus phenolivorans]|uniref:alpha/beta fold hydrolase n=1 Tax=Granulicoccus phenolivorans TaxID=266854 RepID=UPI00040551E8|nr:alpha/beta hydrolase [Granulicoccus phenolivorans]
MSATRTIVRRSLLGLGVIVAVPVLFTGLNVAILLATDDRIPVSHWKSAESRSRFEATYAETMRLLPEPSLTRDVMTDFGTVRAYRFDRPDADEAYRAQDPLVLLPGHSAPVPMWLGNIPHYLPDRPVIAIDLLGQPGLSVPTRPVTTEAEQAAWLDQTLAGLGVERAHLVGVSFGGWTAVNYALHDPARVATLSLLEPAFVFADPKPGFMLAAMLTAFPLLPAAYTDWFMAYTAGGAPIDPDLPEAKLIGAGIDDYQVVEPTPRRFTDAELLRIEAPMLVVFGGRSPLHDSAAALANARRLFPEAEARIKPEGSHAVHGEYADELDARILAFARRHG